MIGTPPFRGGTAGARSARRRRTSAAPAPPGGPIDHPVHVWFSSPAGTAERALLRRIAGHLGCDPDDVRLARGPYGGMRVQRSVTGQRNVHISTSSPAGLSVLALTDLGPVGVDIEPIGRSAVPSGTWCTRTELAEIAAQPADRAAATALLVWTCKEAVVKALGTGLSLSPARLGTVGLAGRRVLASVDDRPATGWIFVPGVAPNGFVGSLAVRAPIFPTEPERAGRAAARLCLHPAAEAAS